MSAERLQRGKETGGREFAPREAFLEEFSAFIESFHLAEEVEGILGEEGSEVNNKIREITRKNIDNASLSVEERELFERVLTLFNIKHSLPPFDDIPETSEFLRGKGRLELSLEIGGPIAVGKTTIAGFLAKKLGATEAQEQFHPSGNPFLALGYENPDFVFRTQLRFLLDNIITGLRGKFLPGRWVRDTSVWSDIFVFMEWKKRTGNVTGEEHQTYMRLVDLLDPLIPRPDLLIMLKPNSIESLWEGLQLRIEAEPEIRRMEKAISKEDLEIVDAVEIDAARILQEKYGINLLLLEVDPVRIYGEPDLKYATVYRIRERLEILKELLTVDPQEVADKIVGTFASSLEPQVIALHSQSMFAGKTSTLNYVATRIGPEKIEVFQPAAAMRYGEEHLRFMIDRDGRRIPAITIRSNRLSDIIGWIEEREINPEKAPIIFIDEVMLFVESNSNEAIRVIDELRDRGFYVVFNGIDYTFQEEPFTFMHDLLSETRHRRHWHQIELGTRCKYCDRPARGTRRLKPDNSTAHFQDQTFEAGDHYEPVCCINHPSCQGQPEDFVRQPLPAEI